MEKGPAVPAAPLQLCKDLTVPEEYHPAAAAGGEGVVGDHQNGGPPLPVEHQDAPILLLDEPNSALDFDNTGLLFRRVRELVETGERTALIVLHDPALALRWCRRLLLLDGGRLVDDVATEGMGAEALQAVLRQLYPTIQVRRDEGGRFYCLPD